MEIKKLHLRDQFSLCKSVSDFNMIFLDSK